MKKLKKRKATWRECEKCNAGEKGGKGCKLYPGHECWLTRRRCG
jgi:hypothetical protein